MKSKDISNLDISEIKGEVIDMIVEDFKRVLKNPILIGITKRGEDRTNEKT